MVQRYKIQQDKGKYCLKGCNDGDLMDYASHAAIVRELATATVILGEIVALVPLSETLSACKTGQTLIEWLKVRLAIASQADARVMAAERRLETALRRIRGIAPLGVDTYRECYRQIQQIAGDALGIKPIALRPRPRCPECGNEIDPDWCHCGDAIKDHHGMSHNHSPVPMGCDCGRVTTEEPQEGPRKGPRKGPKNP